VPDMFRPYARTYGKGAYMTGTPGDTTDLRTDGTILRASTIMTRR